MATTASPAVPVPASSAPVGETPVGDVCATEGHHHGYISDKDGYQKRMRRIEGQARGISKMIDEEKYCIDILTQISALTSALQSVAIGLVDDHLKHCVMDAARLGNAEEAAAKLKEATDAIARLVRS
ncbi:transcriptional regulator [Mycetocola tolaasinivorans]|uniref:Transcriptional regulator n=1 Tax=Mycetocola tolaasinivorans TaxID=76635 RepID=A0A3L7AC45_9MICO|nr:metal-sensitive transcriptional regulator [Mycetocola tolaasinivorans]RLP77923.1 transcriptional regulator [Mycetocola tolaasinivorans]